jgi:hypothetical protein
MEDGNYRRVHKMKENAKLSAQDYLMNHTKEASEPIPKVN